MDETRVPYLISSNENEKQVSEEEYSNHDEYDEAIRTWNLGKDLGLVSNYDELTIQAPMEKRLDRKKSKKIRVRATQNEKKKKIEEISGELPLP